MILALFSRKCSQQLASVVAGDASACMTTSIGNTIATEHSRLMLRVFVGGTPSACSKFAHECNIACGQYRIIG